MRGIASGLMIYHEIMAKKARRMTRGITLVRIFFAASIYLFVVNWQASQIIIATASHLV